MSLILLSMIYLLIYPIFSCLLDIVGARFHCAICANVDICSNCESAGLPGNLEAPDGGHDSSHIMIKVRRSAVQSYPINSINFPIITDSLTHKCGGHGKCESTGTVSLAGAEGIRTGACLVRDV